MNKELTDKERWDLAAKLEGILGADLDPDEEEAIEQAIRIICPEYAEGKDTVAQDAAKWYENTTPEQRMEYIKEQISALKDDKQSGNGNVVPFLNRGEKQ